MVTLTWHVSKYKEKTNSTKVSSSFGCTLYLFLLAWQVRDNVGNSGFWYCVSCYFCDVCQVLLIPFIVSRAQIYSDPTFYSTFLWQHMTHQ